MANMSYCRWQNIRVDLRDAIEALEEKGVEALSGEERHALKSCLGLLKRLDLDELEARLLREPGEHGGGR